MRTRRRQQFLDIHERSSLGVWSIAIPALIWACHLHFIDLIALSLFRLGDYRQFWGGPAFGSGNVFGWHASITLCLFVLSVAELLGSLRRRRRSTDVVVAASVVCFVAAFGGRLAFLGTHHLDDQWYAEMTSIEPIDHGRNQLGLVLEDHPSKIRIRLDSCEVVEVSPPRGPPTSRVVLVKERIGRYTGQRQLTATDFVRYDDLCSFLSRYGSCLRPHRCLHGGQSAPTAPLTTPRTSYEVPPDRRQQEQEQEQEHPPPDAATRSGR